MSSHVFVDESKRMGYLLVGAVVAPGDLDLIRKMLRGLVLPGQRRLHMKDESEPRKRSIAAAIAVSGGRATIYDAGRRYRTERERRSACLRALVADAAQRGDAILVLERESTLIASDRKLIYRATRDAACRTCAMSTGGLLSSNCLRCLTRSPGAGPKAGTGGATSNPWSPRSARSDRARQARSPSATVVRPGLGLTSTQLVPRATSSVEHRSPGPPLVPKTFRGFLQWSQHRWNEGVGGQVLQAHDQRERAGVLGGVAAW